MTDEARADGTPQGAPPVTGPGPGTPAAPAEGGTAGEVDWKQKYEETEAKRQELLRMKTNAEEKERRARELEQENERLRQAQAAPMPPAGQPNAAQQEAFFQHQRQRFAMGDPSLTAEEREWVIVASSARAEQEAIRAQQTTLWYRELDAVPAADRAEVEQRARQQGVGPAVAHAFLKSERFDNAERTRSEETARLQREAENRARQPVHGTAPATPIAAVDLSQPKKYSREQWVDVCRKAEAGDAASRQVLWDYDHPEKAKQRVVVE